MTVRPEEIAHLNESDEEEFKHEKPALNAKQAQELNMNILSAMNAAQNIARQIDSP